MILLVHNNEKVIKITDLDSNKSLSSNNGNPLNVLFELANQYQNRILIWCNESLELKVNLDFVKSTFKLKNTLLSYSDKNYISEQIGYVEDSLFIKVNKKVKFPTWMVSSCVGVINSSQLLQYESSINKNDTFDFGLNSIAKLGISQGLFCYSEPSLVNGNLESKTYQASVFALFKFVKLHYKSLWSFLLLINLIVNESKFPILPFLRTLFIKKLNPTLEFDLDTIEKNTTKNNSTIDVIIPTLGRKAHVYNVLKDLEAQLHKPNQVIVIEQNSDIKSVSMNARFVSYIN